MIYPNNRHVLRGFASVGICVALVACGGRHAVRQEPVKPVAVHVPTRVVHLPGALDDRWLLQSNTPELIEASGLVLATWKGRDVTAPVSLDHPVAGAIRLFSHHVFSDERSRPGARRLELAWVARAAGEAPARLDLLRGSSYLSQPDAPFVSLRPVIRDASGSTYSGPGDRVARDQLLSAGNFDSSSWLLTPGADLTLLATRSVNTDVPILPARNGRTTSLDLRSDAPVHLAEIAWVGRGDEPSPDVEAWLRLAREGPASEPRERPATPEDGLPGVGFRYGRVGGLARGQTWKAALPVVDGSERLAFPIASVWRQRFGTPQVQSADLVARIPGSAYLSHGNYQVEYDLAVPVMNPSSGPRTFHFRLVRPLSASVGGLEFLEPPVKMVYFRGSLAWEVEEPSRHRQGIAHLQVRGGEWAPPFLEISVAPGATASVRVRVVMPADATPPQAFVIDSDAVGAPDLR